MDSASSTSSNFLSLDDSTSSPNKRKLSCGSSEPLSLSDNSSSSIYDSALDNSNHSPDETTIDDSASSTTTITEQNLLPPNSSLSKPDMTLNSSGTLTWSPSSNKSNLSYSGIGDESIGDGCVAAIPLAAGALFETTNDDISASSTTTLKAKNLLMPNSSLNNVDITLNSSLSLTSSHLSNNSNLSYSGIGEKASDNGAVAAIPGVDGVLFGDINESQRFIQSESTKATTSQEQEVGPKSQLASKTIIKVANPNSSIIEIDNSINEQDLKNSVVLVQRASDDEESSGYLEKFKAKLTKSPLKPENSNDKRRKKPETLIQTSKQKLDVAIAEASAAANVATTSTVVAATIGGSDGDKCAVVAEAPAGDPQPETKRAIKVYDTIKEFEENLPSTVSILETPFGSKVYLVGTAHFSEESQDDVSYVIRNVRPDVVMVELCPSRIHILKMDEKTLLEEAKNFTLAKIRGIIQAHGYINGVFFILLLQMSAQIAKDLGMAPGGEFRRAFEEIHKLPGCILHLGDRPIRITLHRALRALSLWQTIKLVWRLTSTDTISIEEVEECKQRDLLEKLMQEMAGEFPAFSDVFVKERDLFLCHSLQLAALPQAPAGNTNIPRPVRVVGVVGIGHANGIAKMWGRVDPSKIPAILEIPPASLSTRICKYTLKYGFIGLTILGAIKILRPRLARLF